MPRKTKDVENKIKTTKSTKATKTNSVSDVKKTSTSKKSAATKATKKSTKVTSTKKSTTSKKSSLSKNTMAKKSTVSKTATAKKTSKNDILEYYDLPYRYNETLVKILYQTPETIFVYWDIADKDRENYIKQYGENFFNITRPVLIIHNETMHYSFEIPINDYANSWYLHVNDSKCNYRVELGRRPNYYNQEASKEIQENIHTDYIYVSDSNKIESPNDHVLFSTNENNTIRFRNVKNNFETTISLFDIISKLPGMKKYNNIPYISEELLQNLYAKIYQSEDISLFERLSNPSSGAPSSGSMPARF